MSDRRPIFNALVAPVAGNLPVGHDEARGSTPTGGESAQTDAETCDCCHQPFTQTDARFNGRARYSYSPFCRRCVDRCHESDAFHECPVCRAPAEGGEGR